MIYRAWLTGDVIRGETIASEADITDPDESGWVDTQWSRTQVWESRNDVAPVATYNPADEYDAEDYPTVAEWIAAVVSDELGAAADNGDGTWYGQDTRDDYATGDVWSYALHFEVKGCDARGWFEAPVLADGKVLKGFARR